MRKTIIILLSCVAVLLAGYAGYRSYRVWKSSHMMSLAHQFLAQADGRNALLCVQQVLRSDPHNLDATRMMAQLTAGARLPSAVLWWSRVVELNPRSLDDRLAMAQTALIMGDYATATNTLGGVDPAGRKTMAYHNVAGAVAATTGQSALAEAHFLEALRLDPENSEVQLNLAVVRLHTTNETSVTEARAALKYLSASATNSFLRCQALRDLALDALQHRQRDEALALSKQLLQETNSLFADRLLRLEVLQQIQPAGFKPALVSFEKEAANDSAKISQLATWQMANLSPTDALTWLRTLPATEQTNQVVEVIGAECYTMLKDWHGLQSATELQNWGELDFVRHAFLSRSLRGLDLMDSSKAEWELALQGANGQKQGLAMLLRLAAQWNWQSEAEEILWAIVNRYPGEESAVRGLTEALYAGGRTRSLMQLFTQESKRDPNSLSAKNNLAMTALLLNAMEIKPYDLAREVYQSSPTNASFVSTYAFSLYLQGKNADALKLFQSLPAHDLQNPSISGYYGLVLKATGDSTSAKAFLNWANRGLLLPEEKKLFADAKAGL
jgi:predicted Zn-dependent protease